MTTVALTTRSSGSILQVGVFTIRVLEDGFRTDNRIGAVEVTIPPGVSGPPQHVHRMHDETFLVTSGTVRFSVGDTVHDAQVGDYVVAPIGAPHTFGNASGSEPAVFFNTFTPAFYVNYFRELADLFEAGKLNPEAVVRVMTTYATFQV